MKKYKRVFLIVLDSLGIGEAHDAYLYDDEGANTLGHICLSVDNLNVPYLKMMGLGNLGDFRNIEPVAFPHAYNARLTEVSNGKDTITGHWEMMGIKVTEPFLTFTHTGFPSEFIKLFEEKTGRHCVGNYSASGTEIIEEWGEHQLRTGDWIVYTSADSVFQIAANEKIISLDELYNACEIARELAMNDQWKVGRIIARPFIGRKKGEFKRTSNRHDWALQPFHNTVLDNLKESNFDVIGIGKIPDIFADRGITKKIKTISNDDGMQQFIEISKKHFNGLAFLNLVDFDAVFGHRRDVYGYAHAIESFDKQLEELLTYLNEDDLLIITADHGNDPTFKGTDHTRENVPLLIYNKNLNHPHNLGLFNGFYVIGATIAENFDIENPGYGESILNHII